MYMFDLNRWPIIWAIVVPNQIKHVHSGMIDVVINCLVGMGLNGLPLLKPHTH